VRGRSVGKLRGREFRHRCEFGAQFVLGQQPDQPVDEGAHGRAGRRQFGELELGVLKIEDPLAEGGSILGVGDGLFERDLGDRHGPDGGDHPFAGQAVHQLAPALLRIAEQRRSRQPYVVEEKFGGVLRLVADLLQIPAAGNAVRIERYEEQGYPLRAAVRMAVRRQENVIGDVAVGNEDLGAVHQKAVARLRCAGPQRGEVAAPAGLGQADAEDRFSRRHRRQDSALLLLCAVGGDHRRDDVPVHVPGRRREAVPAQFLYDDSVPEEVAAGAAIFLGDAGAEQAHLAGPQPDIPRRISGFLPVRVMRDDLGFQKRLHGSAEHLVVRRKERAGQVGRHGHGSSRKTSKRIWRRVDYETRLCKNRAAGDPARCRTRRPGRLQPFIPRNLPDHPAHRLRAVA